MKVIKTNNYYKCTTNKFMYKSKTKKLNGYCVIKYNNSNRYYGYCLNNLFHGNGTYKQGNIIFFGNFKKGKKNGYIKIFDYNNTFLLFSGIWTNNSVLNENKWYHKFFLLINFINENQMLPSTISSNNQEKIIGVWLNDQNQFYKKKNNIMKNKQVYNKWTSFIDTYYKEYVKKNILLKMWNTKLELLIKYIDENNKLPDKKNNKLLLYWTNLQK